MQIELFYRPLRTFPRAPPGPRCPATERPNARRAGSVNTALTIHRHAQDSPPLSTPPPNKAPAKNPTGDEQIRRRKSRERGNQQKYPETSRASPKTNKGRSDRSPSRKTSDLRYKKNTARILAFQKGGNSPRKRPPPRNRSRPPPKTAGRPFSRTPLL